MITPNELRSGNIIEFDDHTDIVKVEYVYRKDYTWFVEWTKVTGVSSFKKGNSILEDFIPIPLDTELLEKCGFVTDYDKYLDSEVWYNGSVQVLIKEGEYAGVMCYGYFMGRERGQYLHKLQNLCYCVNGTELIINLKTTI